MTRNNLILINNPKPLILLAKMKCFYNNSIINFILCFLLFILLISNSVYAKDYYVNIKAESELKSLLEKYLDFYTRSSSNTSISNENNKEENTQNLSKENTNQAKNDSNKSQIDDLSTNSYANQQELNEIQFEYLFGTIETQAKKLLETKGYFNPEIKVNKEIHDNKQHFNIEIIAGERVKISKVNFEYLGEITQTDDFKLQIKSLEDAWLLPSGSYFHQELWSAGKSRILQSLQAEKYLLAKIVESKIDIYPQHNRAEIKLVIDSGPSLKFGKFIINGLNRYSARVITNQATFNEGNPYKLTSLFDLQNRLDQDTHFKQVVVKVDSNLIVDNFIPVNIKVVEQEKNKLDLGLKYDSVDRIGGRVAYDYLDFFYRGYIASVILDASQTVQSANFGLAFPRNAKGTLYNSNFAIKHSDIQQVKAISESANILATRHFKNIETTFAIEFLNESNHLPTSQYDFTAFYLSLGLVWRDIDNLIHPKNGLLISGKVSSSLVNLQKISLIKNNINLGASNFKRAYFRINSYWTSANFPGTFVFRGELGQLWANTNNYMPNSLSFRAGGANSLRGYNNYSLGSYSDSDQIIIGGRFLAISNFEYLYPISEQLSFATFFDRGNASRNRKDYQAVNGYGIGLRWFSPIAPIAFDVAFGDKDKSFHWYLSLAYNF